MQRLTRCLGWFGAMLVIWGCSGDPVSNKGTPTDIVADPGALFVTQGDSQAVIVTAIDETGQSLVTEFTTSNVGAGITTTVDPNFFPTVGAKPIDRQGRIFVKAVDVTSTTFTVNALGISRVVRVTTVAPAGP